MLRMTTRKGLPAACEALATDPGRAKLKREHPEFENKDICQVLAFPATPLVRAQSSNPPSPNGGRPPTHFPCGNRAWTPTTAEMRAFPPCGRPTCGRPWGKRIRPLEQPYGRTPRLRSGLPWFLFAPSPYSASEIILIVSRLKGIGQATIRVWRQQMVSQYGKEESGSGQTRSSSEETPEVKRAHSGETIGAFGPAFHLHWLR